ncbi:hypothetical protein [Alkalicoccus chagannorensis]|uniref:hypothetical protein n=1 Tax=Alkalicoccus chagannorensis TaxID=427072 RepID=UPI0003F6B63A|nr:hypothetical protein [Alkalicoccus chagannorensis]
MVVRHSRFIKILMITLGIIAAALVVPYEHYIAPHSHYIENTFTYLTIGVLAGLVLLTLLIPKHQSGLLVTSVLLCVLVLAAGSYMWGIRPYTIHYIEVPERMEMLDDHLEETYPERDWEMERSPLPAHSDYMIWVTFEDEPDITYHYTMRDSFVEGKEEIHSTSRTH